MSAANFQPTTTELALSNQIFLLADPQKLGIITGDAAIKVFGGAHLSNVQLGEVWALADADNNGFLTRKGVAVALRLIGWAQKGETPTAALLAKAGPVAQIEGVSSSALPRSTASPAPRSPQPTGTAPASSSSLHPPLLPQDRAKFLKLFNSSGPLNGLLAGDKAREIFLKSKLPYDRLAQIWTLADTRSRGALDSTDFIIAMYLIQASMSNALPTMPAALPPGLYEAASGGVASHSTGASSVSTASPTAPAFNASKPIPRNFTGQSSQIASPQFTGQTPALRPPPPAIPPRSAAFPLAAPPPPVQQHWDVTAHEKSQSDTFFDSLDPQRTGFVGGDVAGPFLMESNLGEDVLAQVWDLVDSRGEGRLSRDQFAVVMHIINNKLAGKDIPAVLPPSLVPPSMRGSTLAASPFTGASAFQQQPPPQPQRDLFSLDDTPPPSAVQPPVQPQFTGQLSQQMTGQSQQLPRQITGQQSPPVPSVFAPAQASPFGASAASSPFGQPAASSPFGQAAFSSSSAFGQAPAPPAAAPNQFQYRPAPPPPPPQSQLHKDLLGDDDDEAPTPAANLQTSAEIGNVKNQLASTERTLETTRQERASTEKTVESNAAQLAALQTQLASARASYETESKLLATLKERFAEQTREIAKTREELIAAESDLSAVKLEKTEVGGAALRDKDDVRALQRKMKEVADETEVLKAELEKAKKDARQQKGLLAIAKKQLASAEADRARAQKELEEAQAQALAEKKEVDDVNEAIEKLNAAAAVAPVPAAPAHKAPSPSLPVEEAAIPLPPTAVGTPVPGSPHASLNPFAKLARQDTLAGTATPPRAMSPFGTLPFSTTAIATPPVGPTASPAPEVAPVTAALEVAVAEPEAPVPAPMSATSAGDDPFGLDKFDEVFSTPTESMSPTFGMLPPGLDAFTAAAIAGSPPALEPHAAPSGLTEPAVAEGQAQFDEVNAHFPPVDAVPAVPDAVPEPPATGEDLPPIKDVEPADDDTSSDEEDKFTHVVKPSDSDDWASAKEHADGAAAHPNGVTSPAKPAAAFEDLFGEPIAPAAPAAEVSSPLARAKSLSPATSNASSPRRPVSMLPPRSLSSTSLGAKDPFGMPQSFDATPFEPPVGEQVPPPIIETVLEPSPSIGDATGAASTSGVSDFDEAMGRLPGSGVEPAVQFSSAFDDNFDFGSPAFEAAPVAAAPPANGVADKGGFDDVFGLNGTTSDGAVAFPAVGSPVNASTPAAQNNAPAQSATFDDVFGTSEAPAPEPFTGKANGHAPNDSISTTETGSGAAHPPAAGPARPLSPATSGSHGASTPPRQASPPPPGLGRSTSMRFRSSSPKPKDKAKAKESPEGAPRHSKLSLSFFGRKDKKDKKSKKEAQQHLTAPDGPSDGATTPAAEDDIDGVKQLCAMGFSRTQAVTALEKHGYDVQLALNSLLH